MVDNVLCYFLFRLQRIILATFAINNANLVCIMTEAGSCIIQGVKDDKVEVFAFELSFGRARDFPEFKSRDPFAEADKIMRICDDVILFREEAQR